jgi:hypothetical protein
MHEGQIMMALGLVWHLTQEEGDFEKIRLVLDSQAELPSEQLPLWV